MATGLAEFETLADDATVRIVPIEGGLAGDAAAPLLGVLRELLAQWREGGTIRDGAVALLAEGHFVAVAFEAANGDVSGCTKDRLTHTLLDFEKHLGRRMLNAPRLAVGRADGGVDFMSNVEFRTARSEGRITAASCVYDHLVTRLSDLREGRFETTVGESWYARIGAA